ncbi:MAG: transposase [Bacteroidetes bacterium]|nr:transposase [Bacteroidota bacterium]
MRKRRKLKKGAKYHVTARANLQIYILQEAIIKEMFLKVLIQAKRKYLFIIIHFSIMDNHIHLIIKPTGRTDLSTIMQWVLSVFAIRYNKKYNLKGHVWYDRFHSKIIDSDSYMRKVFCYISHNPIKGKLAKTIYEHCYSGIYHYKHRIYTVVDPPDEELLAMFPYLAA